MRFLTKVALAAILISVFTFSTFADEVPAASNACITKTLPCNDVKGLFFRYPKVPFLRSDMPYEILQGSIIADSIAASVRGIAHADSIVRSIGYNSDTMKYALKYIYRLMDYEPLRFHNFLLTGRLTLYDAVMSYISHDIDFRRYVNTHYILHVRVNSTEFIDDAGGNACLTKNIAYCTVLEKLKGQRLPCLGDVDIPKPNISSVPNPVSDFGFSYCHQWVRASGNKTYPGIYDGNNEEWIKSGREYIIFASPLSVCAKNGVSHYSITPEGIGVSFGMFPIENGFVLDEDNSLGFGEAVPVDEFKQRIYEKIDIIRNYGE